MNLYINGNIVVYSDSAPAGSFTDETNNYVAWDLFGLKAGLNLMQVRTKINDLFLVECPAPFSTFGSLTAQKKEIAARYFLVPKALRLLVVSDAQDQENSDYILVESKIVRTNIIELIRAYFSNELRTEALTLAQINQIGEDFFLLNQYFINTGNLKILSFLNSTDEYVGIGFASKDYYSEQRKDDLINYINNV